MSLNKVIIDYCKKGGYSTMEMRDYFINSKDYDKLTNEGKNAINLLCNVMKDSIVELESNHKASIRKLKSEHSKKTGAALSDLHAKVLESVKATLDEELTERNFF